MNLTAELDVEGLDIALLALMVAEDIQAGRSLLQGLQALRQLRAEVLPRVPSGPEAWQIAQLTAAMYGELGFAANLDHFHASENCLLGAVIPARRGIPISLGILLLHLAQALALPAAGICFPGHFLVRLGEESPVIIDPLTGQTQTSHDLDIRLRASEGNLARLAASHLLPASQKAILQRLLQVAKGSFLQAGDAATALRCSEALLVLSPDNPYERRDRGLVLQQLACPQLAAADLDYFIEQCPADPMAGLLKQQVRQLAKLSPVTLH